MSQQSIRLPSFRLYRVDLRSSEHAWTLVAVGDVCAVRKFVQEARRAARTDKSVHLLDMFMDVEPVKARASKVWKSFPRFEDIGLNADSNGFITRAK